MSDDPPIDPIPPTPQTPLPKPPKDAADDLTKFINQIDNDNEGARAGAAYQIYRMLRSRRENFKETYQVELKWARVALDTGIGTISRKKIMKDNAERNQYIYEQNVKLTKQVERLQCEIAMLRKHVSDNTYKNIRNHCRKR
jgi:hypothetical protein